MQENTTPGLFKSWKIAVLILLALTISGATIVTRFSAGSFAAAPRHSGTHIWLDANHNGKIDFQNTNEFVPSKHGNYQQVSAFVLLKQLHWSVYTFSWLLLALFAMIGRDLGYLLRIRMLSKKTLSWKQSLRVILLWEFASALAPGIMSGATVAMFILKKEGITLGKSTAMVLLTAIFDNLFYLVFIPIVVFFNTSEQLFPSAQTSQSIQVIFWIGYAVFFGLTSILFLTLFRFPNLVLHLLQTITRLKIFRKWQQKAQQTGQDLAQTAKQMQNESWGFWLKIAGATCLSWTSRFLVINAVAQAFIQLGLAAQIQLFTKQFVLWMLLRVSPTPGGSGVAEWAFGELVGNFSVSIALVGTMAVVWRLISYFPYLLIGTFLLPSWLQKRANPDAE